MLQELYIGYKSKNFKRIKAVEHKCANELVLAFDRDLFNTCLLCFMVGKLISKKRFEKHPYLLKFDRLINDLKYHMNSDDYIGMRKIVSKMITLIDSLDSSDKKFINKLAYNGKIKIASKLYAQGISLSRSSKVTGADEYEILNYIGKTMMADRIETYMPISKRLEKLEKVFLG
ncbi:hypothetical protein KO465_08545 [Candidatus Micrarchaeota archaeon]|nr:hypothetical protein [Candidatus Micrarchaeota archaeon]